MLKKPAKKKTPTPEYDPKRQQNVLLEEMNKSIKAIAESHGSLVGGQKEIKTELGTVKMAVMENSREIKGLKAGQMENSREIKGLKAGQEDIKVGQESLKAGQMENSREIKGLKAGQEDLKAGQKSLKESLERVEKKLDTVADDHEHRLQKLEAAV